MRAITWVSVCAYVLFQFSAVRKDRCQACFPRASTCGRPSAGERCTTRRCLLHKPHPSLVCSPTVSAASSQSPGPVLTSTGNGAEGPVGQPSSRGHQFPLTHAGTPAPYVHWAQHTSLSPEGQGAGAPAHPSHWGPRPGANPGRTSRAGRGQAPDHLQVSGSYLCREDRTGTGGTFWCKNPGGIKETRSDQLSDQRPRARGQVHP